MDNSERRSMGEEIGSDIDRAKHLISEADAIPPLNQVHEDPLLDVLRSLACEAGVRKDDAEVMDSVFDLLKDGLADGPISFNPSKDEVIGEFKHSLQEMVAPTQYCAERAGMMYLIVMPPFGDDFNILVAADNADEGRLFYFDETQHRWRSRVAHEKHGVGSKRKVLEGEIEQLIDIIPKLELEPASEID